MVTSFTVQQNLYPRLPHSIVVAALDERRLNEHVIQTFQNTVASGGIIGVSAIYGKGCAISSIAFASMSCALVVDFAKGGSPNRRTLKKRILNNPQYMKCTFRMDTLAVALFLDMSLEICNAVDLLSLPVKGGRRSAEALTNVMGDKANKDSVKKLFFKDMKKVSPSDMALQAWAAFQAATLSDTTPIPRIDTSRLTRKQLVSLCKISRSGDLLGALKPTVVKNDVRPDFTAKKDEVHLTCTRYRSRLRVSQSQVVIIETSNGTSTSSVSGRTKGVKGRQARVLVHGSIGHGSIVSVSTIGKEDLTYAQAFREDIILGALQSPGTLVSHPFFQSIWLPHERVSWKKQDSVPREPYVYIPGRTLNSSQEVAVKKVLSPSDDDRLVVIQGPPGTGKTTVIAAAVTSIHHMDSSQPIWIAAQSNVAVKNIAEKLSDVGFYNFRLLVSQEFHFDWHEHLYEKLESCLIRSDVFSNGIVGASRQLLGSKVILCTLSMLSNPDIAAYIHIVPIKTIIFDEASQIEVGDYVPVIHRFGKSLTKMVFIGDQKQLAPYGQEEIRSLESVFEFDHLLKKAVFLNTQYRLPCVVGNFISQRVYAGKLSTRHIITDRKACRFIDVRGGQEAKQGHSWINRGEATVVIRLAEILVKQGKSFRIITPYDAQRTVLETGLKTAKLPWENKVFNVDSFQGNEDDHIIVSVVRTFKIGFLQNERRTNVMLTRCKRIGQLAAFLGPEAWIDGRDVLNGRLY
ncbi:hypothetical protein ID866_6562 [Astraeus odoratus]|nr:hypothetical protein ID866_6562 [Astraeus odoratus]